MGSILLYWLLLIMLVVTYIKQGLQTPISLSSSKETVLENSSVALTSYNKTGLLSESRWKSSMQNELATCVRLENECKKTRFLNNNDLMDCSCDDDGTYTVTIKHVDRYQYESRWRCVPRSIESNTVVINVSVPVTHAILNYSQIDPLYENRSVTFTCTSSYSLPSALIRWYSSYNSSIVEITDSRDDVKINREKHTVDNVIRKIETLTYMGKRLVNGWIVLCTATNWQSNVVTSKKIELSVMYPLDKPPVIDGFSNGSTYKVTENEKVNLSCSVKGGNPLAKPQWHYERTDNTTSNKRITNNGTVTSYLSCLTKRTAGKTCICHTGHVLSNVSIYIIIDVLYPPGTPNIKIQHLSNCTNVTSDANLIENKSYRLLCMADSNPPPEYIWYGPHKTDISHNASVDLPDVKRTRNGTYTCRARNTLYPKCGENCTTEKSNNVKLEIS